MMLMSMACLVAKDSSSPLVLKLTLHSLVSGWEPDLTLITQDHSEQDMSNAPTALSIRPSVIQLIGCHGEILSFLCIVFFSFVPLTSFFTNYNNGHIYS